MAIFLHLRQVLNPRTQVQTSLYLEFSHSNNPRAFDERMGMCCLIQNSFDYHISVVKNICTTYY